MLSVIPSGMFGSNFTRKIAKTLITNNENNVLKMKDFTKGIASLFTQNHLSKIGWYCRRIYRVGKDT